MHGKAGLKPGVLLLLSVCLIAPPVWADDTDSFQIRTYVDGPTMVMLNLDLHPTLAQVECTAVGSDECRAQLGDDLYLYLDLLTHPAAGEPNEIQFGPDGVPDAQYYMDQLEAPAAHELTALRTAWSVGRSLPGSYMDGSVRRFDVLRAALQHLLRSESLQQADLWLGLMVSHEAADCDGPNSIPLSAAEGCSNGGYILKGLFDVANRAGLQDFFRRLAALPTPTYTVLANPGPWRGHSFQFNELYLEFYRYITGQNLYNAWLGYADFNSVDHTQSLTDHPDNDAPYASAQDIYLAPDPAIYTGSHGAARYLSPFDKLHATDWSCTRLYMVNMMFGPAQADAQSHAAIADASPQGLALQLGHGTGDAGREAIIRRLYQTDLAGPVDPNNPLSPLLGIDIQGRQNLTSLFVSDAPTDTQHAWAAVSETGSAWELGVADDTLSSLESVFSFIFSGAETRSPSPNPGYMTNRSVVDDTLFLALVEPGLGARWSGNVKKLKLRKNADSVSAVHDPDKLVALDAQSPAQIGIDPTDGGISHAALTYWTDPLGRDVTPTNCLDGTIPLSVGERCGRDGRSVERGGAGQKIPGYNTNNSACFGVGPGLINGVGGCSRRLYTQDPDNALSLMDFNADSATAELLGEWLDSGNSDPSRAEILLRWIRGATEVDTNLAQKPGTTHRWMMGDVLHSNLLSINYGGTGHGEASNPAHVHNNPDIRLLFGSNDGWFRMLRDVAPDDTELGAEVWGFMPLEVMHIQQALATDVLPASGHPYGVDGKVTALIVDRDADGIIEGGENNGDIGHSGDKVFAYFGLRRGGKAYYALDISDPDSMPKLLWKISNAGDFSELGLSFSAPHTAIVNYRGARTPVIVVAGGYNGGWTDDGTARVGKDIVDNRAGDDQGNAVYVIDALTGKLIWKTVNTATGFAHEYVHPGLDHSIPSAVSLLDSDGNGVTDMGFVGDTGGNVWRIDLPESKGSDMRSTWKISRLGAFGYDGVDAATDRRFFHAPDLVLARDGGAGARGARDYIGIVIGSGNRAAPLRHGVRNYLYYIKDSLVASGAGVDRSGTIMHGDGSQGLTDITEICPAQGECEARDLSLGWQLQLGASGEKSLSSPLVSQGVAYFSTYIPGDDGLASCIQAPGHGRFYAVTVNDGGPAIRVLTDAEAEPALQDRYIDFAEPGIPAPPIPVSDENGPSLLKPNGEVRGTDGRFKWKTYWTERNVDGL